MMKTPETSNLSRLAALDGLRGIFALLVATLHFEAVNTISRLPLVKHASLFVDFFFVLSGFVIAHAYAGRLQSTEQVVHMLWRRLARLWPLHLAVLAAFILFDLASAAAAIWLGVPRRGGIFSAADGFSLTAIPTHIFMLQSFGLHSIATWNIPSWSVSAEFWTTVVFANFVLQRNRTSLATPLAIAGIGACVVMVFAPERMGTTFDFGFFRCLYGFFIGYVFCELYRKAGPPSAHASHLEISTAVLVIAFVSTAGFTPFTLAAPLVFGITIWVFAGGHGPISRLLKTKPLQHIGRWSYSIYMIHALVILMFGRVLTVISNRTGIPMTTIGSDRNGVAELYSFGTPYITDLVTIGYLAAVIAISAITWRYIEMPCQRALNRRFNSQQRVHVSDHVAPPTSISNLHFATRPQT